LLLATLSACFYSEDEIYVHEPTHELRENIQQRSSVEGVGDRTFVLIPDFRYFGTGYAEDERMAFLYILSTDPVNIEFDRAIVTNRDSGFSLEVKLNRVVGVGRPLGDTGYFVHVVGLISPEINAQFIHSTDLLIDLRYVLPDGTRHQEEFEIRRTSRRGWKFIEV
jgi:hypothetical protein